MYPNDQNCLSLTWWAAPYFFISVLSSVQWCTGSKYVSPPDPPVPPGNPFPVWGWQSCALSQVEHSMMRIQQYKKNGSVGQKMTSFQINIVSMKKKVCCLSIFSQLYYTYLWKIFFSSHLESQIAQFLHNSCLGSVHMMSRFYLRR